MLDDWKPDFDATVVTRLREAGAVILGKTNMHEWAKGSHSVNPFYGTPKNPWNPAHIPGGSSSGSGVAVAASLCLASIGTDAAGSVRNPASLCGIVGLNPPTGESVCLEVFRVRVVTPRTISVFWPATLVTAPRCFKSSPGTILRIH